MSALDLNTPITEIKFAVADTETTGMVPERGAKLVEIAAVLIEPPLTLNQQNCFSTLINPEINIPYQVSRIHGITNKTVLNAPLTKEAMQQFIERVDGCVLVFHNAPFDMRFINSALSDCQLAPTFTHVLDTVKLSRRLYPTLKSHSLDALIEYHSLVNHRQDGSYRHRALYDSDFTAMLFLIFMEELLQRGVGSIGDLFDFLKRKK
ncbi:MAG: 3'-5' exonuclease [Deferribacteraceae bacterium]|jgi:DNA polymerase-3 subunit epsilon|nr:3'-5' exonuclease [Deferribacteraceae bacterium]